MDKTIEKLVADACSCSIDEAKEYIDAELDNLEDLASLGDLRFDDLEAACENLGLDADWEEYFINRLAGF